MKFGFTLLIILLSPACFSQESNSRDMVNRRVKLVGTCRLGSPDSPVLAEFRQTEVFFEYFTKEKGRTTIVIRLDEARRAYCDTENIKDISYRVTKNNRIGGDE